MKKTDFWTDEGRVDVLRAFLRLLLIGETKQLSTERALDILPTSLPDVPEEELPGSRALRDFINKNRRPQNDRNLSHLLRWSVGYVDRHNLASITATDVYGRAAQLLALLDVQPTADGGDKHVSQQGFDLLARSKALSYLQRNESHVKDLNEKLFAGVEPAAADNRRTRHYLCYRYNSRPGEVVKSFLVLKGPPTAAHIFTEFDCYFADSKGAATVGEDLRVSTGWVLAMGASTYLLGQIDRGAGLKVIAVPHFERRLDSYPGLILSMDDEFNPVAGRCVIVPSPHDDALAAGVGILDEAKHPEADFQRFRSQFKNRMDFRLNTEVRLDGEIVQDQKLIVDTVRQAVKGRFTYADGRPFNPADTEHYTFNVALRKWDKEEG